MKSGLRLYHYWRSSSSWRVRWGLAFKGVQVEYVAVNLLSDEPENETHRTRNPLGYVPVLEQSAGGTSQFLGESVAILEWLEETHPSPSLYPKDAWDKARVRQLCEIINSGTQPLQNLNALYLHSSDPEEQKKWARHWIVNGLTAYDRLASETAGKFSFGDSLTMADLFLVPQLYNAKRQELDIAKDFPRLQAIWDQAASTSSYQASEPERFKPNT